MPAKSKATKKSTSKSPKSTKTTKKSSTAKKPTTKKLTQPVAPMTTTAVGKSTAKVAKKSLMSPKAMTVILVVIAVALLTYKFGPWLVPAVVDGKPITRFAVWNKLEKDYGEATLSSMVDEKILNNAIKKSGVTVDQSKVDEQIKSLETQFESVGGLDAALEQRGLTRDALREQIVTQLSVEEILADKVGVSEDEVMSEFDANKETLYKDQSIDDVKDSIENTLKESKLRDAFLEWFDQVKKDTQVKTFGL